MRRAPNATANEGRNLFNHRKGPPHATDNHLEIAATVCFRPFKVELLMGKPPAKIAIPRKVACRGDIPKTATHPLRHERLISDAGLFVLCFLHGFSPPPSSERAKRRRH
jgi:hypothetical protein